MYEALSKGRVSSDNVGIDDTTDVLDENGSKISVSASNKET
jgi:hypothetical protein